MTTRLRTASLITVAIAFLIVFVALANTARASEIEFEVIQGSWDAFLEGTALEDVDAEDVAPYLADMLDIMNDTDANSYCETYSSGLAFWIATYQSYLATPEYDRAVYANSVVALRIVEPELDRLATQCIEEE